MSKILFMLMFAISSSTFAGAPPPGAKIGFGRETFNPEEVVFFIGATIIYLLLFFLWNLHGQIEMTVKRMIDPSRV